MAKNIKRWITMTLIVIIGTGMLVLAVMNIWYGIVAAIIAWALSSLVDWEYLLGLEEQRADREM